MSMSMRKISECAVYECWCLGLYGRVGAAGELVILNRSMRELTRMKGRQHESALPNINFISLSYLAALIKHK